MSPTEDSEIPPLDPPELVQTGDVSHKQRAYNLAESVRAYPLTNNQATELAKVYASLAIVEAVERLTAATKGRSARTSPQQRTAPTKKPTSKEKS